MICRHCAKPLPHGPDPRRLFCSRACKNAFTNEQMLRGRKVLEAGLYWRASRSKEALSSLCWLLDGFNREDLARGRPRPPRPPIVMAKVVGMDRTGR